MVAELLLRMKIAAIRKRLVRLAEKHGRTHPLVIAMSRRLDALIVESMRMEMREAG